MRVFTDGEAVAWCAEVGARVGFNVAKSVHAGTDGDLVIVEWPGPRRLRYSQSHYFQYDRATEALAKSFAMACSLAAAIDEAAEMADGLEGPAIVEVKR